MACPRAETKALADQKAHREAAAEQLRQKVIKLVFDGYTDSRIATRLDVPLRTVRRIRSAQGLKPNTRNPEW